MVRGSLTLGSSTSSSFRDEHVLLFLQPRALHTFRSQHGTGWTNQPFLFLTFTFALPTLCAFSSCRSMQSAPPSGHKAFTERNKIIQSNCRISAGPLFVERRTMTGGPHRWLIACLIDSSVNEALQRAGAQLDSRPLLLPVTGAVHSPSLRRIFLPAPFAPPFHPPLSTIFTGSMSRHKSGPQN
ncbi:hypothetical protein PVAP13_7NG208434, partial [Panicum virgatum]